MDNKNKFITPILLLVLVIAAGVSGFFLADVIKGPRDVYDEYDEIAEILNRYHYSKPSIDDLYYGAVEGMADSVDDKYTYIFKKEEEKNGSLGVKFTTDGMDYYVYGIENTSPCYKKLYKWDVIKKINDVDVTNMNDTDFIELTNVNAGEDVKFLITRNNKDYEFTFKANEYELISHKKLDNKTGYIKINQFNIGCAAKFQTALNELENGIDKLIIDLRNNGGGSLEELKLILNMFVTYKSTPYLTLDNYDGTKEEFRANINNTQKKPYDIDILVNQSSASASEAFASVMKEYMGYDVIGTKTYGKGVYQSSFELKQLKGYYLNCTIGKWYTPNGNNIHGIGVEPTKKVSEYNILMEDGFDYGFDSVSKTVNNAQNMLSYLGYTGRCDGYFDLTFETYLSNEFGSNTLTEEVYYDIYNSYLDYVFTNDVFINACK